MLRVAFVVCGAINRKDWRTVSVEDVAYEEEAVSGHVAISEK
jgi:hypothetical protein